MSVVTGRGRQCVAIVSQSDDVERQVGQRNRAGRPASSVQPLGRRKPLSVGPA